MSPWPPILSRCQATLPASPSGAFSAFLLRGTRGVTLDDVARITADQVAALVRFVDQVNPDVLQHAADERLEPTRC